MTPTPRPVFFRLATSLRDRLPQTIPGWTALILGGLIFLFIVFTYSDQGITWDEEVSLNYGQTVLNYYTSGFSDKTAVTYQFIGPEFMYGGFSFSLPLIFHSFIGGNRYTTAHLITPLFILLALYFAYQLAREISGSSWVGLTAVVFVLLIPRFTGHMYNNFKDFPFAVLFLGTIYYIHLSLPHWKETVPLSLRLKLAVPMGLCLGIRVGALLLVCYLGFFYLAYQGLRWWRENTPVKKLFLQALSNLGPTLVAAYGIMLLCWPWALEGPLTRPWTAFRYFSESTLIASGFLYRGEFLPPTSFPRYYIHHWLVMSTPPFLLVGAFLMATFSLRRPSKKTLYRWHLFVLWFATLFPLAYAFYSKPPMYNGVRHFMFVFPLMAVLAALGFHQLYLRLHSRWSHQAVLPTCLLGLTLFAAPVVHWYYKSYPYHVLYFNFTTGGLPGAWGRYELDYWGFSYREGAEWLNQRASNLPRQKGKTGKITVFSRGSTDSTRFFLDKKHFVYQEKDWEYLLVSTSRFYREEFVHNGKWVVLHHTIDVDGVPIMAVYRIADKE